MRMLDDVIDVSRSPPQAEQAREPSAIARNQSALERLRTQRELVIVPQTTCLFEDSKEPQAERLASDWFVHHLAPLGRAQGLPSRLLALAVRALR
jgi:hypothetical protein